ncbi:MAG: hypothetical protein PHO46_05060, partial [Thermoguttaceae bacterium]|nr:hypothetical protein [Thermoguttaceae bacterium]
TLLHSTTEYGYGAYGVICSGASITIEDNDDWIVSVTTTDGVAEESPSTSPNYGTYTITRANEADTTHPLSVRFQMTGTASNSDYTLYTSTGSSIYLSSQWDQTTQTYIYTGSVSIPSSSFSTTVELRPNNDAEREQSETAIMTLLPSTTEYGYGAYGVTGSGASITIEDNDDWIVSLGAADNTATEGLPADYGTYTITRSNETDTTHSLSVRFQMTGTATNQDYTLYTSTGSSIYLSSQWDQATQTYIYMGNVDIPSGSLSTTVELRPTNDVLREETETAIMTALPRMPEYGYGSYTVSSSSSSATVSIEDNDNWTVSVTSSDSTVAEGTPNNYGTYAITRSGETDVSTALDVQFKMTGTATNSDYALYTSSGSSIYLSSQWDPTSQSYVYSGSISIPVNSFSVTVELRPYDDSCAESDDETACMSIQPSDRYAVSSTNGSAVVTIEDNDLWKINVDSTDNVAKERLLGVAQDYGVYTFTKEYSEENVIGDNSYSITIEFDLLVYSYSCHYCATPGTDYTLSTTPLNADDTTVYLQNFSSLGMTTTQTSNGNVYRYRYQGTIPSGKSSASLRLEALFDWLDEGDYYDLDGSPEAQRGESALLTMTAVSWSSKGSWDALGSAIADEIEIKDGAILELYLDYDGDNSFDIDESITDMICFINHNDDDDNNNNLEDKLEGVGNNVPPNYAGVEGEDDLRKGRLYAWVADLEGTNNQDYKFDVFQNLPTGALEAIRLWNESDKATLFEATNQNPDRRLIGTINSACTSVSQEFWMEGIAEDINNLSANAYCYRQDGSGVYVANTNYDAAENTDIYDPYPHSPVDIDVDSDNNGYVNSVNNETRMLAEDAMEGRVGKPITYYGSTFADVPANYAYVKIINRSEQITDPNVWYSFNYTPNLEVYELTNGNYAKLNSNYKFKLSTKPLSTEYYVKAVGNNSGTGFPSGNDKVHLIFWKYDSSTTPPYTELGRDTVCFKVQDNTKASAWMIPSGWTINSNNTFTTPTPTAGAVGPKTEDSYEVNSGRYAKSSVAYPNGFELSFDLSFVGNGENGYLQPDTSGNEVIDGGDLKKLSFVGNSGVKIGGTSNVPEVAILDFCALVNQVDGVDLNSRISTLAQSLKDNLGSVKISDYTKEPLLNLMNGVRYGGRSDSVLITPALSSARTAQEYKNFLEAYYPKSQSAKGMKITLQNGFLNVYFTFENLDDYLVYSETGIANTDGYIYLQPHWGSGVKFENITIMGYPSP